MTEDQSAEALVDGATFQLLPPLNDDDYERLRTEISELGVCVPVEVDERGTILDGHHRKAIADELGIEYPTVTRVGMAEHEKRLYAVALNLARRQLTDGQKAILGRKIEPDAAEAARRRMLAGKADPGDTCPQGRGLRTRDDVAARVGFGSGRTYERNRDSIEEIEESAEDLFERVASGSLEADRAARILRDRQAEAKRATKAREDAENKPAKLLCDIRHGDFREVLADLTDVDAIITDPPYPREFLPLLSDLAVWADKVLKPDGILAVLFGQTYLPEVYRRLDGHRPYRWTISYQTPGAGYVSHSARVQSNWKPVLVYGGGSRFSDTIVSKGTDAGAKDLHDWGQDSVAFQTLIERLTRVGDTVVDPFAGSGTTLLAANAVDRHAIGAELDAVHVATARQRVA